MTRLAALLFLVCALSGCSKGNNSPAPAAQNPNPYGYAGYGVNCAGVGGIPVNGDGSPYAGRLTNVQNYGGGYGSDSVSLNLFYQSGTTTGYNLRSVVGTATFNTSSLLSSGSPYGGYGGGMGGGPQNFAFCVTSVSSVPNGGVTPGDLDQSYMPWSLSITLQGNVQLPPMFSGQGYPGGYGNPGYGGYPSGGYGQQQPYAEASIGNPQCPAMLYQGRLMCGSPQQGGGGCPCIQVYVTSGYGMTWGAYYMSQ